MRILAITAITLTLALAGCATPCEKAAKAMAEECDRRVWNECKRRGGTPDKDWTFEGVIPKWALQCEAGGEINDCNWRRQAKEQCPGYAGWGADYK